MPGPQFTLSVQETDNIPTIHGVNTIEVSPGTLTDLGSGKVLITTSVGASGFSGFTGISGFSGFSGANPGASGYSGFTGISGWSGFSGPSGYSGFSSASGFSGFSGYSGFSGKSGYSGYSGYSGFSGFSGGTTLAGADTQVLFFDGVNTPSGDPGFTYNKTTDSVTLAGALTTGSGGSTSGNVAFSGSASGIVTLTVAAAAGTWTMTLPTTDGNLNEVLTTDGNGTLSWTAGGAGASGVSGFSGFSGVGSAGTSGFSGFSGANPGASGFSGFSGQSGYSGFSGAVGTSGFSGFSGKSGFSGFTGAVGTSGFSGFSGVSGYSGFSGGSGFSGFSGIGTLIPLNSQSTSYTTVASDAGKGLLHPVADTNNRTYTIDSNANVPFPIGTTLTFINQVNTLSIAITADTLTLYPGGSTGTRTLAAQNMATAIKLTSTSWAITGSTGLT